MFLLVCCSYTLQYLLCFVHGRANELTKYRTKPYNAQKTAVFLYESRLISYGRTSNQCKKGHCVYCSKYSLLNSACYSLSKKGGTYVNFIKRDGCSLPLLPHESNEKSYGLRSGSVLCP